MKEHVTRLGALLVLSLVAHTSFAQMQSDGSGRRIQGGGLNYAPLPEVYTVVAVDGYRRVVTLRDADGTIAEVRVPEGVHDVDELDKGDRIQVDFFMPDRDQEKPAAARIWPVP